MKVCPICNSNEPDEAQSCSICGFKFEQNEQMVGPEFETGVTGVNQWAPGTGEPLPPMNGMQQIGAGMPPMNGMQQMGAGMPPMNGMGQMGTGMPPMNGMGQMGAGMQSPIIGAQGQAAGYAQQMSNGVYQAGARGQAGQVAQVVNSANASQVGAGVTGASNGAGGAVFGNQVGAGVGAAKTATGVATKAAVSGASKAGFFATVGGKITAGVVAAAVVAGGATGGVMLAKKNKEKAPKETTTVEVTTEASTEATTGEVTTEATTEVQLSTDEKYISFVNDQLIPLWGMPDIINFEATVYSSYNEENYSTEYTKWYKPDEGIISYKLADYDGDDENELAVFFIKKANKEKRYITLTMYDIDQQGEVAELDDIVIGYKYVYNDGYDWYEGYNYDSIIQYDIPEDVHIKMAIDVSNVKYENKDALFFFRQTVEDYVYDSGDYHSDSSTSIYYTSLVELKDGKLQYVASYTKNIYYYDYQSSDGNNTETTVSGSEYVYEDGKFVKSAHMISGKPDSNYKNPIKFYEQFGLDVEERDNITTKIGSTIVKENARDEIFSLYIKRTDKNDFEKGSNFKVGFSYDSNTYAITPATGNTPKSDDGDYVYGVLDSYWYSDCDAKFISDDGDVYGLVFDNSTKIYLAASSPYLERGNKVKIKIGDKTDHNSESIEGVGKWYEVKECYAYDYDYSYYEYCAEKPVIYLYPEEETDVTVHLDFNGRLTCTYPKIQNGNEWKVTAKPDGTLVDENGMEYNYLYWEGEDKTNYDMSKGFCVAGKDTEKFLEEMLPKLGLTRKEANEFIVYWLPRMEQNEYNIISFQQEAYTNNAKLTIDPNPDTLIRVYMTWSGVDEMKEMQPQEFETPERLGFTAVEWGGNELK